MKINLTSKDILWSYIGTILSMGANLIMLPLLMYYLDEDMLGLWYVFASVGTLATLFDFGFSVTFARNITYCWSGARALKKEDVALAEEAEPDFALMKRVLATCKRIYGILAGAALFLLLTVGTAYIRYITREIPGYTALIAWAIYAVAAFLNLYYGYYASFLRGVGAVDRANKNTVFARLAQILVTFLLLAMGTGLTGACIAYLTYGTVFRLLGKHHFYRCQGIGKKLAQVHTQPTKQEIRELFRVVWHNAWRDGVISVSNYLCNQASTVICSMYLSLAETGIYSIGVQIASAIATIAGTLYNACQPELQWAYVNGNTEKMRKTMSVIVTTFVYLFILGAAGFTVVGIPMLKLVKPETVVSVPVLMGLYAYQFVLKLRNCYTSYFSCTNRILYVKGFVISAVLCVALSFILIGPMHTGIWGLIAAQIASQAVYNLWKWPVMAHKELELLPVEMLRTGSKEFRNVIRRFLKKGGSV